MAMDVVQKQVLELSSKVDTLHGLMEQLTDKVSSIALLQSSSSSSGLVSDDRMINLSPVAVRRPVDPSMMHKDVLSDEPHLEGGKAGSSSHGLSPEIQIQRLTAQLTAAYNRMAALEEQILACRFQ
ncbi:MAG: hypothetical protein WBA76_08525 [Phormidesmis sp.]